MTSYALVGFGPHASRIHIPWIVKRNRNLKLIVDLKSRKTWIDSMLKELKIDVKTLYIEDSEKDLRHLSPDTKKRLRKLVGELEINRALVCTEPKSHLAYIEFFLSQRVPICCDKPLTSIADTLHDEEKASELYTDAKYLHSLSTEYSTPLYVMAQRRNHPIVGRLVDLSDELKEEFRQRPTFIDIFHSDGQIVLLDEQMDRENHPFKYGYGKLLHSGYHFVDLVAVLLNRTSDTDSRLETRAETTSTRDWVAQNKESLSRLLSDSSWSTEGIDSLGEYDVFINQSVISTAGVITRVRLNLFHSGFSRRSWAKPKNDLYKGNGRVRRERIHVEFGHLASMIIESYQAHELGDRSQDFISDPTLIGYTAYIFRNSALIGGMPVEIVKNSNTVHNEDARIEILDSFDTLTGSSLVTSNDYVVTAKILSSIYRSIIRKDKDSISIT